MSLPLMGAGPGSGAVAWSPADLTNLSVTLLPALMRSGDLLWQDYAETVPCVADDEPCAIAECPYTGIKWVSDNETTGRPLLKSEGGGKWSFDSRDGTAFFAIPNAQKPPQAGTVFLASTSIYNAVLTGEQGTFSNYTGGQGTFIYKEMPPSTLYQAIASSGGVGDAFTGGTALAATWSILTLGRDGADAWLWQDTVQVGTEGGLAAPITDPGVDMLALNTIGAGRIRGRMAGLVIARSTPTGQRESLEAFIEALTP